MATNHQNDNSKNNEDDDELVTVPAVIPENYFLQESTNAKYMPTSDKPSDTSESNTTVAPSKDNRSLFERIFLSIYSYTLLYALFGVLSLSYHACFNASLSTLEKRFRFSSSTGALIMITDNIATVLTNLFIGYYGKTAHKPRWMAIGSFISGVSVMITALPYFIYGSPGEQEWHLSHSQATNMTLAFSQDAEEHCSNVPAVENCAQAEATQLMTIVAVVCFAASNFFRGFGTSIYLTYGTPYLDDNVSNAKMPTFFAFIFSARIFGAPVGFYMTSVFLKLYESPFNVPAGLSQSDPRWIGAWWVGFVISGSLMILLAIPLAFFPREFKKKHGVDVEAINDVDNSKKLDDVKEQEQSLKNLPLEIWQILSNPMITCQMFGNLFRGIGVIGYFVFQSKYIEAQFKQSASSASLITGTTGFLSKIVGVLLGGIVISLLRPKAQVLTTFIFLVEVTSVIALLYGSTVVGPQYKYPGTVIDSTTGLMNLNNDCNRDCNCNFKRYVPICESSNMNSYFSPCHAGCKHSVKNLDNTVTFTECSCVQDSFRSAKKCFQNEDKVKRYATIIALGSMISGSSRSGNMVTFFRSIKPDQKSLAVAVASFWQSFFVSIPYPLLYGFLFDSSCMFWSYECNKRGNCWSYDTQKLRYLYHYVSIVLIALGSVFDLIMIFLSPRLGDLYGDVKPLNIKRTAGKLNPWRGKSLVLPVNAKTVDVNSEAKQNETANDKKNGMELKNIS